jgi:hypothetical protein
MLLLLSAAAFVEMQRRLTKRASLLNKVGLLSDRRFAPFPLLGKGFGFGGLVKVSVNVGQADLLSASFG